MEAESYDDEQTAQFINDNFVPLEAHIKEHPVYFHRFQALWTPTVVILDSNGVERHRIDGYLPNDEFRAQLEIGLARLAFTSKKWAEAETRYAGVLDHFPNTKSAAEALYWRGVSSYKVTNDHTVLGKLAEEFKQKYSDTIWALKSIPWNE